MTIVFYHASCPDGMGAALAARLALGPNVTYKPIHYSDPVPDVSAATTVFVVDFSFPAEVLDAWDADRCTVVVLDHHKTAAHLADRPGCVWNVNKSGAVLAWEYFHPSGVPLFFRYLQDRDLWQWALPGSHEVSAGLAARPQTMDAWIQTFHEADGDGCETLKREGKAILAYQANVIAKHVKHAWTAPEYLGFPPGVRIVNATSLISEIGHALLQTHPDAPFVAMYQDLPDRKRIWSLRSEDTREDVSVIAKARGGGGHRNAAGFTDA